MVRALRVFLICMLIGLLFGLYFYIFKNGNITHILNSVLSSIDIGCLMMLVIYQRQRFLKKISAPSVRILLMIIAFVIVAVIGSELTLFFNSLINDTDYQPYTGKNVYFLNMVIVLVTGLPMYMSEELKENMESRVLKQEYDLLRMEQLKTLSDLETLRAKINPHFLYNVHNTIVGLIRDDPETAEKMTILLSKFFRSTLDKDSSTYHSVADELEIIKTYLEMQQIRYKEKLVIKYDVEPGVLSKQIPSFIIQPLIENAIKHGIEKSRNVGYIHLEIRPGTDSLSIKVMDSGPPFPEIFEPGVGHKLILSKLNLLCNRKYEIAFKNKPEKFAAIILFPNEYSFNS